MISYWEKKHWFAPYDFTIVGSGIVGLNTAINLKKKYPNKRVAILERGAIPNGASTKNAGFSCFGSVGEILDDSRSMNESEIAGLLKLRWEGLNLLKETVGKSDMDYIESGGFEVFGLKDKDYFLECEQHIKEYNQIIESQTGLKSTFSTIQQSYGLQAFDKMIVNQYEGAINPAKMIGQLLKIASALGIIFHWNYELVDFDLEQNNYVLKSSSDIVIRTDILCICTNAFTAKLLPAIKLSPGRNQVLITTPIANLKIKGCYHFDKGYVYFRNVGDRVLIGGARNQDLNRETTAEMAPNEQILEILKIHLHEMILPDVDFEIEHNWSGIIATGDTKAPIIEQLEERLFIAVRLGGMGVAIGSIVGKKLAELIK